MTTNPITSIIGIFVAACPLIGSLFPEAKEICDNIMQILIGAGFVAAADGVKKPALSEVKSFFLWIGSTIILIGSLSACSQLKELTKSINPFVGGIESAVAEIAEGEYKVVVTKDGKVLYEKTVTCTKNEKELTGCHER